MRTKTIVNLICQNCTNIFILPGWRITDKTKANKYCSRQCYYAASTATSEPEYSVWSSMRQRCINTNNPAYQHYGGRGIKVCDRWLNSYTDFINDMGRRPSDKYSIDRIDNNGNYEPSNCRWTTMEVQSFNQRVHKDSKSGVRGVSWSRTRNRWLVNICIMGKNIYLGQFRDLNSAIAKRKLADKKYLNIIMGD